MTNIDNYLSAMKSRQLLTAIVCVMPYMINAQSMLTAKDVIQESIKYHDPSGLLSAEVWTMHFEDSRPDGSTRDSYFRFNPMNYDFEMMRGSKEKKVILKMEDGQFSATLNGSSDYSGQEAKDNRLDKNRATMMRNYYHYLWCMPMKLNDPGTIIDNKVKEVDFFGKASLEIKVTYTPEVGKDIWYFYFHPESKAMHGYRFYHDESANDGEYITLDNEVESNGVRIPQIRKWYTHKAAKFLGEDKLVRLEVH